MWSRPFQLRSTLLEVAKKLPLGRIRQMSIIPTKTRLLEIRLVSFNEPRYESAINQFLAQSVV